MRKLIYGYKSTMENLKLPHISNEELIEFLDICSGKSGSSRFHNTGTDGLFLHSLSVAVSVCKTDGYLNMPEALQRFLVRLALYHDFETKVAKLYTETNSLLMEFRNKFVRPTILAFVFAEFPSLLIFNPIVDRLYYFWQYKHHGLVDGLDLIPIGSFRGISNILKSELDKEYNVDTPALRFLALLMEVSRCDSYDAAFSAAKEGASSLFYHIY